MLRSAFRGKEGSKMVISKFSLESKILHNFQVNFSNMIGKAFFIIRINSSADDLEIANKNQSTRS